MSDAPAYDSLFNVVTRRLRASNTIFADSIKLSLRQLTEQQYALLKTPYLLVVPTFSRPVMRAVDQQYDSVEVPRTMVLIAQFSGYQSEDDHRAANDIELAEKQLMGCLINWRPAPWFKPTYYSGMAVQATSAPHVKVAFTFHFVEQFGDCEEEPLCEKPEYGTILNFVKVSQRQADCEDLCLPSQQ